jgi:hypothetical protein
LHDRNLVQLPFLFEGDIIDLFIDSNGVLTVVLRERNRPEHTRFTFLRFALRFVTMLLNYLVSYRSPEPLLHLALFAAHRLAARNPNIAAQLNQFKLNSRLQPIESFEEM